MNRVRLLMVLVVALLAGGGLAAGTYSYLNNVPVKTVEAKTKPVVVARANLALGAELRAEDVETIPWPETSVPEGAFSDPAQVVGRGIITPVVRHEAILPSKLASKEAGAGLPPIIPNGKRAMSVRVNDVIGVAGYVLPGTYVDVIATASPTARPEDMTSKIVLNQVQVLTAGTRLEQDTKDGEPMQVTVVTLLVTPEESERLTLASTEGKIQLALRHPLDATKPATPGIQPGVLLGRGAPRAARAARPASSSSPYAAPAPAPTVEIIRGDKRERTVVG